MKDLEYLDKEWEHNVRYCKDCDIDEFFLEEFGFYPENKIYMEIFKEFCT